MEIRKIDDRIKNTPNYVFKRDINYSIDWITVLNVHGNIVARTFIGSLIHKSVIYITKYIHICIYI